LIRALIAAALLVAATAATAAQDGDRAQQEAQAAQRLAALRAQIAQITAEQREHADEKAAATTALRDADAEVSTAVRTLRATEAEIATSEAGLVELQQQKSTLEAGLSTQRVALARLVRSAYALGRHEQLKLLLAQDRVSDLARVLAYHRYFQADRAERIEGLLAELQQLADVVRAIDAERTALETARIRQQAELATLESRRDERRTLLAQLEAGFRDRSARLAALGRDEQAVVKLLERLRDAVADIPREVDDSRPFASRRGQLPPPLVGTRLAGFGGQLPDGRGSDGLLIAGTAGAEVRAVAPGRVAYSDWLKGYGLLTIVDHGDGWMSLYAFNDALLKDVGDWVRAGDPLATVGSSGGQGRAALYFELRRDGQPQDPRPWLR
jgi:septal ring factor EnvC (AmiA/AmiB activator)